MTTSGKLLSQDDVDAILAQSGIEGDYDSPEMEESPPPETKTVTSFKRSDEDAKAISYRLYNSAFLEREEGISVIWNAYGVISMDPGAIVRIQGKDYLTLGVLQKKHLIVGRNQ